MMPPFAPAPPMPLMPPLALRPPVLLWPAPSPPMPPVSSAALSAQALDRAAWLPPVFFTRSGTGPGIQDLSAPTAQSAALAPPAAPLARNTPEPGYRLMRRGFDIFGVPSQSAPKDAPAQPQSQPFTSQVSDNRIPEMQGGPDTFGYSRADRKQSNDDSERTYVRAAAQNVNYLEFPMDPRQALGELLAIQDRPNGKLINGPAAISGVRDGTVVQNQDGSIDVMNGNVLSINNADNTATIVTVTGNDVAHIAPSGIVTRQNRM